MISMKTCRFSVRSLRWGKKKRAALSSQSRLPLSLMADRYVAVHRPRRDDAHANFRWSDPVLRWPIRIDGGSLFEHWSDLDTRIAAVQAWQCSVAHNGCWIGNIGGTNVDGTDWQQWRRLVMFRLISKDGRRYSSKNGFKVNWIVPSGRVECGDRFERLYCHTERLSRGRQWKDCRVDNNAIRLTYHLINIITDIKSRCCRCHIVVIYKRLMNNPLIRHSLLVTHIVFWFPFSFSLSLALLLSIFLGLVRFARGEKCWSMSKSYVIHLPLDVCVLQCSLFLFALSLPIVLRIEFIITYLRAHVYICHEEEKNSWHLRNENCRIRYEKKTGQKKR